MQFRESCTQEQEPLILPEKVPAAQLEQLLDAAEQGHIAAKSKAQAEIFYWSRMWSLRNLKCDRSTCTAWEIL